MDTIVQIKNLKKSYRGQQVLQGVDLCFEKGKIYGIIGPNGAGKTTIFKILAGLVRKNDGEIEFFGGGVREEDARKKISFMIENPYLEPALNAYQNMKTLANLYGVEPDNITELLRLVGLENAAGKKVKNFSLGMKQRLGIALALLKNPEMIVLDEPMNGLDPKGMVDMRNLLLNLRDEKGVTIVVSSHLLHELELLGDIFYLIDGGMVIGEKTREEIKNNENLLEEYYMEKTGVV